MIVVVVASAFNGDPTPAGRGAGFAVAAAVVVFTVTVLIAIRDSFPARTIAVQSLVIGAMGASGVALVALQPKGASTLAGAAAVWMALTRLPFAFGLVVGAGVTVGLCLAMGLGGASTGSIVAAALLCALLGLIAYFLRQARASQDRTEVLLAELEDAREEQSARGGVAERGADRERAARRARAFALRGRDPAAGARKLAEREQASAEVRAAIDRAGELVQRRARRRPAGGRGAAGRDAARESGELGSLVASFSERHERGRHPDASRAALADACPPTRASPSTAARRRR